VLSRITDLKICVSSRRWLVFEDKFRSLPKLGLEDHNYDNIYSYAFDKLVACSPSNEIIETDTAVQLATRVTRTAQGVFL